MPLPTILERILDDTRDALGRRRRDVPLSALESRPLFDRTPLSLADALRRPGLAVIAELKKASPSRGLIRADFDVTALAQDYAAHGAAALSVLTEPLHFQGSLDALATARSVTDLPLLRKDFILDPYQIFEARAFGADAVLLIAAALERGHLDELLACARELGLSALVEVHDPHELDRLDFDRVDILGVNNRDLHTFTVDRDHAVRVFAHVPEGPVRVAESGMKTAEDLAAMARAGVDAVLMGEALMRAEAPGDHLAGLLGELARLAPDVVSE